jgi:cobalt-zinc-cadmium efflux system outer membrane protein
MNYGAASWGRCAKQQLRMKAIQRHLSAGLALCLIGWSFGGRAAERTPDNVEGMIAAALAENPEIAWYEAQLEIGRGQLKTAGARQNPTVSIGAGHKRVNAGGIDNGYAFTASMSQRIEFPQRIQLRKAIANGQIELSRLGLEKLRATIGNRIRAAAFGWQSARERAEAADRVARRTAGLLEALTQRDPAGVAPLLEQRVIEAHLVQLKRQARTFAREAAEHRREMNYLAGLPLESTTPLQAMRPALPELATDARLMELAETNNFDLRFHIEEIGQQGFRVKLARHERWPSVTLSPFFMRETGGGSENIVGLGFSVPLPIWNRNEGRIETAEARREQLQASVGVTLRRLHRDLAAHAAGYRAVREQMGDWNESAFDEFKRAAEMGDRHFRLGAIEVATYLELQTQYLEAIDALLEQKEEAYEHLLELELLTGTPLAGKAAQ